MGWGGDEGMGESLLKGQEGTFWVDRNVKNWIVMMVT